MVALYTYLVRGTRVPRSKKIKAKNEQDAVNKAARLYPNALKSGVLGIERLSTTGRGYETVWVTTRRKQS